MTNSFLPLTLAQENIWFDQLSAPNLPAYNICFFVEFKGLVEFDRLKNSWEAAIGSLENMRAVFSSKDGKPSQKFLPFNEKMALRFIDLSINKNSKEEALTLIHRNFNSV